LRDLSIKSITYNRHVDRGANGIIKYLPKIFHSFHKIFGFDPISLKAFKKYFKNFLTIFLYECIDHECTWEVQPLNWVLIFFSQFLGGIQISFRTNFNIDGGFRHLFKFAFLATPLNINHQPPSTSFKSSLIDTYLNWGIFFLPFPELLNKK